MYCVRLEEVIVWISCPGAVECTACKLTLVYEFINIKLGERSGLNIHVTELLFNGEQKFVNGMKIIYRNLGMSLALPLCLFHILMLF